MHVVIFEGSHWSDFLPLTLTRPVFCLRSGASTLLEKQLRHLKPTRLTLWCRPEMAEYVRRRVVPTVSVPVSVNTPLDSEPALIFSGRTLHLAPFEVPTSPCAVIEPPDQLVRFAYVQSPGLSYEDVLSRSPAWLALADLPHATPQTRFPRHWADLIGWNDESIASDAAAWKQPPPQGINVAIVGDAGVHAEADAEVGPNVVLDARKGPILIGRGAVIGANSVIEGPCHIGDGSRITPLSLIRAGTSVGPHCRVGGEVSSSIFHGHSNKSHDGFLGDSYVGEWVNLGAGTTTSNLKSTYGLIKLQVGGREVPTERLLLGCAFGDYAKAATYTLLPAGGYVGVGSMVALSQRLPRYVPSFQFWSDEGREPLRFEKAAETDARMQARRKCTFDDCDAALFDYARMAAAALDA